MERVWGVSCVLYEVFGYVSRSLEFVGACPQKLGRLGVGARERIDALLKRILQTSLYRGISLMQFDTKVSGYLSGSNKQTQ